MKFASLMFLASVMLATAGGTITTAKGLVFEEVEVRAVTPINVAIRHKDGTDTLNFADLDEATRAKLGYDPATNAIHLSAEEATIARENALRAIQRRSAQ